MTASAFFRKSINKGVFLCAVLLSAPIIAKSDPLDGLDFFIQIGNFLCLIPSFICLWIFFLYRKKPKAAFFITSFYLFFFVSLELIFVYHNPSVGYENLLAEYWKWTFFSIPSTALFIIALANWIWNTKDHDETL